MIQGTIILEDTQLRFILVDDKVTYTVMDSFTDDTESRTVGMERFFKALAIAVHPSGTPNSELDYPEAEMVQPNNVSLRWIP